MRPESGGAPALTKGFYGRSQAGAVLRFSLAPTSGHHPLAYSRVTRDLVAHGETELAAGVAARPLPAVPVSFAGEVRVTDRPGVREVRPAVFAVTELPTAMLPLGLRAEVYAEAGYVGGRFATAFADGEARLDERLMWLGKRAEIRLGGGLWGGAQRNASRLDVGPSATTNLSLGRVQSRVAVEYRVRVAGEAKPKSGPAFTFSAGF